ncbi:hypothetical protein BT93_D1954 [Corymbia citriodora subsp. variegata]|nr:hypothetical protein BT93_D1954 [Corymbia citriodora subsp. variegata]
MPLRLFRFAPLLLLRGGRAYPGSATATGGNRRETSSRGRQDGGRPPRKDGCSCVGRGGEACVSTASDEGDDGSGASYQQASSSVVEWQRRRSSRDQPTERRLAEAGAAAGGSKGGGWLGRRGVGPRSTAGSSWLSPSWLCLSSSDLVSSLPAKLCCIFLLRFGSGSLPLLLLSLSRSTLAGTSKPDYASGNQLATRMGDRAAAASSWGQIPQTSQRSGEGVVGGQDLFRRGGAATAVRVTGSPHRRGGRVMVAPSVI